MSAERQTYVADLKWLGLALVVAVGVLTFRLGWQGYWWDEDVTLMFTRDDWRTLIVEYWALDTHRPVFYGVQKAWIALFGESVWAVRALPVALSLPIVPLFYAIAKRLPPQQFPLITIILLVTFPVFVFFGREIRMYGMLHIAMAVGLWLMALLLERQDGRTPLWAAFAGAMAIGFYAHPIAILIAALYGLWCLFCVARGLFPVRFLIEAVIAFGFFLVLIFPALQPFWGHMTVTLGDNWWVPGPDNMSHIYYQSITAYDYPGLLRLPILVLLLWGLYRLPKDQPLSLLIIALMVGVPLIIYLTSFVRPIYTMRTIAWGSMAGLLVMAYGIASIRQVWLRWTLTAGVVAAQIMWLVDYYPTQPDFPYEVFEDTFEKFDPTKDTFILGHQWEEPELRWEAPQLFEGEAIGLAQDDVQQGFVDPAFRSIFIKRADAGQITLGDGRLFVFYEETQRSPEESVMPALDVLTRGRELESEMSANGFQLDVYKAR